VSWPSRPPGPAHDKIDIPAAAEFGADQPLTPIEDGWVRAPHPAAISAGSGSTWWLHSRHHTISRTPAAAPLPSVIGPGWDFMKIQLKNMPSAGSNPNLSYEFRHRLDQFGDPAIYLSQVIAS
jgi:hypothetical protein